MSAEHDQIETLLNRALEFQPNERPAFLAGACGGDDELRARVETLLRAGAEAEGFMEGITVPGETPLSEGPGAVIGRYKLLQKIGEGGMGVVYMAEQTEPVTRKVALKIIKLGMDTRQVVARFEAERQALAMMDHPNIAKVLDAGGTDTGRPFFVMELVRGVPITAYCDKNKLSTRDRLELFIPVCHAIQHAHQKGVIHRDIKPSNVMVTLHDGHPIPKVIDFGIAKATNQKLTEKTLFTNYAQMIGTPAYMSPEQAEMSGLDVDTRTDVYSLGVLLYELLTGTTPFPSSELMSMAYGEMQRVIAEKDPPKPSTRLSTMSNEERTVVAKNRSMELSAAGKAFRGDLDWIVMKALEKDRTHRYETVNGLMADIKRHLHDEPVTAAAPSLAYQVRKLAKRHRTAFAAVAAISAVVALGTAVSTWQAIAARRARSAEEHQRVRAETAQGQAESAAQTALRLQHEAEQNEQRAAALAEEMRLVAYVSDMKVAQNALDQNNLLTARRLLNRHRPVPGQADLRGLEWRYLWNRARGGEIAAFEPHDGIASFAAYSPDGRFLATAGFDQKLKVWDASTRDLVTELRIDAFSLEFVETYSALFSPDSSRLAAIQDGELKVWDTATWQIVKSLGRAGYPVIFAKTNLLTALAKGIRVWDPLTGGATTIVPKNLPVSRPLTWAISPDGTTLAAGFTESGHTPITLWKLPEAKPIAELPSSGSYNLLFDPSGTLLAESSGSSRLRIWSVRTGKIVAETSPHSANFFGLAFSPDGQRIATAENNQLVQLWTVPALERVASFQGHVNEVWKASFSPDGQTLVTAGKEPTVRFWKVPGPTASKLKSAELDGIQFHRVMAGMQKLESSGPDGLTQFWKIDRARLIRDFRLKVDPQDTVFSDDGRFASAANSNLVEVFDCHSGQRLQAITLENERYAGAGSFSRDNRLLVVWATNTGLDFDWIVLDWKSGREVARLRSSARMSLMIRPAFSPDGSILAHPGPDWTFRLWDVQRRKEIAVLKGHTWGPYSCNFSPDGKLLATSSTDGTARIWEVPSGKPHGPPLVGHVRGVCRTVFTPDSRTLLTAGDDGTVRLWNVATGQEMVVIPDFGSVMLADEGNTIVLQNCCATELVPIPTLKEIDDIDRQSSNPRSGSAAALPGAISE